MAAIELMKSNGPFTYGNFELCLWDIANFFSGGNHFTIIDSYSTHWWSNYPTTPKAYSSKRYKGDPIADSDGSRGTLKVWDTLDDLGEAGDFIVIECQTSIHSGLGSSLPKWQAKIEFHNAYAYDISDPTGVIYANSYWQRSGRSRMCPWGGWDLADVTPDFRPAGRPYPASFENRGWQLGHGGSGNDTRWYAVAADGTLITFSRRNQNAYDIMGLGVYMGDCRPIKAGNLPNPRVHLPSGEGSVMPLQGVGNGYVLAEESYVSGAYALMSFVNHLGDVVGEKQWRVPTGWLVHQNGLAVPNGQAINFEIDTYPFVPCPTDVRGVWFDLPFMRKGYGVGAALIANKTWLSTGAGYCVYMPWDGSSTVI